MAWISGSSVVTSLRGSWSIWITCSSRDLALGLRQAGDDLAVLAVEARRIALDAVDLAFDTSFLPPHAACRLRRPVERESGSQGTTVRLILPLPEGP